MTFNKSLLIPLAMFLLLITVLAFGFRLEDPHFLPSELINKPFPDFELQELHDEQRLLTKKDVVGEISLVNVWGTWCPNCKIEHPELLRISKEEGLPMIGINYNDNTPKAIQWLARYENPFQFNIVDDEGTLAIDLGVYGAPETFVLDRNGVIKYRHVGELTHTVWREKFRPVIDLLQEQETVNTQAVESQTSD